MSHENNGRTGLVGGWWYRVSKQVGISADRIPIIDTIVKRNDGRYNGYRHCGAVQDNDTMCSTVGTQPTLSTATTTTSLFRFGLFRRGGGEGVMHSVSPSILVPPLPTTTTTTTCVESTTQKRDGVTPPFPPKPWRSQQDNSPHVVSDDLHLHTTTTTPTTTTTNALLVLLWQRISTLPWTFMGVTVVSLYALNQAHCLPRPISAVVSRILFWPTLPITMSRRIGSWTTVMDETVIMGGVPIALCGWPKQLRDQFHVVGVVNMCEEYAGPVHQYQELGMTQLHLPTTDHFEPSVDALDHAVRFIAKHKARGTRVYVHCRAGHGRSAAVVMAWLAAKQRLVDNHYDSQVNNHHETVLPDLEQINEQMCRLRDVRRTLWRQPNLQEFVQRIYEQ